MRVPEPRGRKALQRADLDLIDPERVLIGLGAALGVALELATVGSPPDFLGIEPASALQILPLTVLRRVVTPRG